ncbi:MAG: DNA alkylation repair protein [bacterium]|nr:DNA alkylation repair protein [bacterium]
MPADSREHAAGDRSRSGFVQEVESAVIQAARRQRIPKTTAAKRRAIYNTQLEVLGLALPELRSINRAGFSFLESEPAGAKASAAKSRGAKTAGLATPADRAAEKSRLAAWGAVWSGSNLFEAKIQPLLYYEGRLNQLDAKIHWPVLKAWAKDIDNWEHSDRFSKIFAQLLEIAPDAVYPTLRKWNRSKMPWLRRQSIVSLLCYDNLRESRPPVRDILPLVENLLADPDVYVQKGVGWTLRETGRAYPRETLAFLNQHIRALSSVAFSAATEKISKSDKQKLKGLRK